MDLKMAVYAAMIDRVDQNIGKLVGYLKQTKLYDNTLIFFLSDNGGCREGGMLGRGEFYDIKKRNLQSANSYGEAWANASNTPFRLYKHYVHEGGAATPFFMHWPKGIRAHKPWYREPAQLIDVMPTILDVAGAKYPGRFQGNDIHPPDGISLRPAFAGKPLQRKDPIFVEHEKNASVREGDWKLVGKGVATQNGVDPTKWELYNIRQDRTETSDLAFAQPERVKQLAAKWQQWADRVAVHPKPSQSGGKTGAREQPNPPQIKGKSFSVTVSVRNKQPHGVALSHGGVQWGYSLHFVKGRPVFSLRQSGKIISLAAEKTVKGKAEVTASLTSESMTISVGGMEVARRESPGLFKGQPAIGIYIGEDFKDPVGDYKIPNRFNGKVLSHRVKILE